MLRIRLSRVGKKKQPAYRLVVADSRAPRDGAFLEIIGHYNPLTQPAQLVVQEEKAIAWLQKGAQPSEAAAKLLTKVGVLEKAGKQPFIYAKDKDKDVAKTVKTEAKTPKARRATTKPSVSAKAAPAPAPSPEPEAPLEAEATSALEEANTPSKAEEGNPAME